MTFPVVGTLCLLPVLGSIFLWQSTHSDLVRLRQRGKKTILSFSPTELTITDVCFVIVVFVLRSLWPGIRRETTGDRDEVRGQDVNDKNGEVLPTLLLEMPLRVRKSDVETYAQATSLNAASARESERSHASTPRSTHEAVRLITSSSAHLALFLSAVTEPALLLLLARSGCPVRPLGAVNVQNRFEILRRNLCEALVENVIDGKNAKGLRESATVVARLGEPRRRVKRGVEIDVVVSVVIRRVYDAGEDARDASTIWESSSRYPDGLEIFRQIFTVLEFSSSAPGSSASNTDTSEIVVKAGMSAHRIAVSFESTQASTPRLRSGHEPGTSYNTLLSASIDASPIGANRTHKLTTHFTVSNSDPSVWARLCKDYNPIHLSKVAATIYGFRGKIAHGNLVAGRAIEALRIVEGGDIPRSEKSSFQGNKGAWIEVKFRRPVVVPCKLGVRQVNFHSEAEDDQRTVEGSRLEIFANKKVFVEYEEGVLE